MIALLLLLQGAAPTVGDTVWVTRTVRVPAGAVVRAAPWPDAPDADVQPLGPPVLVRHADSVEIRYPLVAWTAGEHRLGIPGPAILGPGSAADSLAEVPITLFIESVLPDSVDPDSVKLQPPANAVGGTETSWVPVFDWVLLGLASGAGALWIGRRRRRAVVAAPPLAPPAPDPVTWARAGELRVAQATALARLRATVAHAVPAAAPSLDTDGVLRLLRPARPEWPLLELEGLLLALEAERFAPTEGDPDLVDRAEVLRQTLERLG
ncbi:MAG: hypothetical protein JF590_03780 [Gemmatimonadetes bacterium]|nr:hypothetical protein [Gemmatimonadota bacterium]